MVAASALKIVLDEPIIITKKTFYLLSSRAVNPIFKNLN